MQKDNDEEHGVEVWNDAGSANDSTPGQAHRPVGDVVGLAGICPPTAGKQTIAKGIRAVVSKSHVLNISDFRKLTHGRFGCRLGFRPYSRAIEGKSCGIQ